MSSFFHVLLSDPAWIGTGLRIVHIFGLVLGVGAATLLDLIIARFILMRGITSEHVYVVEFSSRIVTIGLALLWISGIGFLIHYGVFDPAKLQNPKVWAKIAIVAVLSVNGLLVHYFVLPRIRDQVGRRLFDGLSPFDCSLVLLAGTVSVISWYVPLMLGAIPQLNYVVPAEVILSGYALLVITVNTVIQGAIILLGKYTIPVDSGESKSVARRKMNILRGSMALAFGLVCVSLFLTKTANNGTALAGSTAAFPADEPKAISPPKQADSKRITLRADNGAPVPQQELEQSHAELFRVAPLSPAGQSEEKTVERTVLVKSEKLVEDKAPEHTLAVDSFASLPKAAVKTIPPQLKNGFVGLWAADSRACEFRQGSGSDPRTFIDARGARAGSNSCSFKEKKQIGDADWEMKALCADGSSRWESTVRLSLSKNKLKWSGQRGTQIYVKCA